MFAPHGNFLEYTLTGFDSDSLGAFGIIFGLPVLIYAFTFACNDVSGCPAPSLLNPSTLSLETLKAEVGWPEEGIAGFYDTQVTLGVLSYYFLSYLLYVFLPGHEVEGTELACGGKLKYKFNGDIFSYHDTYLMVVSNMVQLSYRPCRSSLAVLQAHTCTAQTLWCGPSCGITTCRSSRQTCLFLLCLPLLFMH